MHAHMRQNYPTVFSDTKPHYELLDGLRGVAALLVMFYHVFEAFATSPLDQKFNHGFLAVDFFFVLSGFVIGYAYDDRWETSLRLNTFFKRRLIRLHPMVIAGALLGVISYFLQGSQKWDGEAVPLTILMLALLAHLFLIPTAPGATHELRGNDEMFPLNGPAWSLFFEYIGNILYALVFRKLATRALALLVLLFAAALACYATMLSAHGNLGAGWTMAGNSFIGGMLRLLFAFSAGLLMARIFQPKPVKGAFWICSIALAAVFTMPYIGGEETMWMNGAYESACVIIVFPALVYVAASSKPAKGLAAKACKFLGDISYPVYIIHYPSMYLYYSWVWNNGYTFQQTWAAALAVIAGNIVLAYAMLKLYDEPVRKWLANKLLGHKTPKNQPQAAEHNTPQ